MPNLVPSKDQHLADVAAAKNRANHTGTQAAATVTGLAAVATTGAYSDLTGKPIIAAVSGTNTGDQALTLNGSALTLSGNGGTVTLPASSGNTAPSDATTAARGIVQLAGDLAGTAAAPTVPGLSSKVNSSTYTAGLATKVDTLTPTAVKTAAYTAAVSDIVPADVSTAAFTVTLPTAPADKARVTVKKIDSSSNIVMVATAGSDVFNKTGGSTSVTLALTNQAATFQYTAATAVWYLVGSDLPLTQLDGRYAPTGPRTQVLLYSGGTYPARPATTICPAGWAIYKGPTQPTDWLSNDEWVNNS